MSQRYCYVPPTPHELASDQERRMVALCLNPREAGISNARDLILVVYHIMRIIHPVPDQWTCMYRYRLHKMNLTSSELEPTEFTSEYLPLESLGQKLLSVMDSGKPRQRLLDSNIRSRVIPSMLEYRGPVASVDLSQFDVN